MARRSIDPVRDREILLDHQTRRAIARVCRANERTTSEIAKAIGRAPQAIASTIENMVRWGVLDRRGKNKRGADVFKLADAWQPDLRAAIGRNAPEIAHSQGVLWIKAGGASRAAAGLLQHDTGDVAWAISLKGNRGLLVGLQDEVREEAVEDLCERARQAGAECEAGHVEAVISGDEFLPFAKGLRAASPK